MDAVSTSEPAPESTSCCSATEVETGSGSRTTFLGPCYEFADRSAVLDKLIDVASSQAFDEIPDREALCGRWRGARNRWHAMRESIDQYVAETAADDTQEMPVDAYIGTAAGWDEVPFDV
jgi:hypothetical protein